ncbi:MAG: class I SAM-dependent methyltransferase [Thermodesulfovibrionales bacterium]|nr:class I SAM-dependent methyltransferase [Thermodesulfovibrionales bacterium]
MELNLFERLIVMNPLRSFFQRHFEIPMLKRMSDKGSYSLCLEIGAGSGTGAIAIFKTFKPERIIAIDIDPRNIEKARSLIVEDLKGKVEFIHGDAMALDFRENTFDAVFSIGVLHHLEDWKKGIKEISRVLKPSGDFFFEEPLKPFLKSLPVRLLTRHPDGGMFSLEEFKKSLQDAGLYIKKINKLDSIAISGMAKKESGDLS